jgi:hypothetical protein
MVKNNISLGHHILLNNTSGLANKFRSREGK